MRLSVSRAQGSLDCGWGIGTQTRIGGTNGRVANFTGNGAGVTADQRIWARVDRILREIGVIAKMRKRLRVGSFLAPGGNADLY